MEIKIVQHCIQIYRNSKKIQNWDEEKSSSSYYHWLLYFDHCSRVQPVIVLISILLMILSIQSNTKAFTRKYRYVSKF